MPIQVKIKTIPFKDEDGNPTDATFTIRTALSHRGQRRYMRAVTADVPDLSDAVDETGKPREGYRPKVQVGTIEKIEEILLEDCLIDLHNVLDRTGKEIKTWEEFLGFEDFYVAQVIHVLQEIAVADVKKATPSPNASAPSAAR